MPRRQLIKWPEGEKRPVYLTFKRIEEVFGIPESTIRGWRCRPGNGFTTYRVGGYLEKGRLVGGRLCVKCDEFIAWINLVAVEVSMRKFTFTSESRGRGQRRPRASMLEK